MLSWVFGLIQTDNQETMDIESPIENFEIKKYRKLIEEHFPDLQTKSDPKATFEEALHSAYGITLEQWHKLKVDTSFVGEIDDHDIQSDLYILAADQGNAFSYAKCPDSISVNHFMNVLCNGSYQVVNYYLDILASDTEENLFEIPHIINQLLNLKRSSIVHLMLQKIELWEDKYTVLLLCTKYNYEKAVVFMLTNDEGFLGELPELFFIAAAVGANDVLTYLEKNHDNQLSSFLRTFAERMKMNRLPQLSNSSLHVQLLPILTDICNDDDMEFSVNAISVIDKLNLAISEIADIRKKQLNKTPPSHSSQLKKSLTTQFDFKRTYLHPEPEEDDVSEPILRKNNKKIS